ncbi:glycosyltransferase [Aeromonas sp. MdU4]|uniref:glycosyltransferase n=1 Tax=Aeromonas sp. MdU4 TaxID=3342819 RepID=UPI0035BA88F9
MELGLFSDFKNIEDIYLINPKIEFKTGQVSILVPVGRCFKYLETSVKTMLWQTINDVQLVLVNDGSPQFKYQSRSLGSELYFELFVNTGAYGARNYGLKHATGEFITVHDADDWSHPQKLEMQVKALLENPQAVASVSHWARCTTDLQFETRPDGTVVHRNISSLMIRREVFERLGYWDRVSVNADTEYYYRILAAYGPNSIVEVLPGVPLALGRRHEASLTMQPETHWKTQFGGVRKEYMDAAHEWHKECAKTGRWYMPFAPKERPFPVPALIDRAVLELGEQVWPHIKGKQAYPEEGGDKRPCILLCGHAAGDKQFGAERSLLDLAKAIAALDYRLVVTLPERNMAYIDALAPCCSDIVLLPSPWREDEEVWPIALNAYRRLIEHFKVDLVHVNTLVNRVPLLAARELGVKSVLHVRELLGWDSSLIKAMGGATQAAQCDPLLLADRLIANSSYTARSLLAKQPQWHSKLRVVTNTVTLEGNWQPGSHTANDKLRVGMVSSNLPKKGLDDFLNVARAAYANNLPLQFVLIGPDNEHTDEIAGVMPSNMSLAGYARSPEVALEQLDILLNLSHFQESFGRTVAEAMLAGKVVIVYRWGALSELVINGVNGLLVHLGDIDGVIARLAMLCHQPELFNEIGLSAQEFAQEKFNEKRFQSELTHSYDGLIPISG